MNPMDAGRGLIFDIQHFSLHDGPGVRSTVFFKGCPLACTWCSNPESQRRAPELLFFANACARCGRCAASCPNGALAFTENTVSARRERCANCGVCVSACPHGARNISGKSMTVKEVADEVRQHWRVFMQSDGGVTLSGGEALGQPEFLKALLETLHDELGFHTCLETCGHAPWGVLASILPHTDMVLLDVKHMDDERHRQGTGQGNAVILENAGRLARTDVRTLIRLPLIPGFNDDSGNITALARFMKETGLPAIEILPYHEFGVSKYEALGKTYTLYRDKKPETRETQEILTGYGLDVAVAGQQ